jgi:ligand-binding sensor domain-containing protein
MLLHVLPVKALQASDFTFSHISRAEGLDNQRIFSICQTPSGAIWWSSMTGVGRYNGSTVKIYGLDEHTPYSHLGGRVIYLTEDSTNIYAYDNRGDVYRFDFLRNRFEPVFSVWKMIGHEVGLNDIVVWKGCFYLAMHDGVYLMKEGKLTQIMKCNYANCIVQMAERLLFCARDGVYDERVNDCYLIIRKVASMTSCQGVYGLAVMKKAFI